MGQYAVNRAGVISFDVRQYDLVLGFNPSLVLTTDIRGLMAGLRTN